MSQVQPTKTYNPSEIGKLILKARAAQFGPDWSRWPAHANYMQRITYLIELLAEVTNALEQYTTQTMEQR